ncbi:MAG: CDP-alcohol phosphatidyltransferase family protein [Oscillospiraceae bacterium]|nr:CDP-alcohol phosphatidyltransferase family protein [Oscillospiraceae bacterium]
MSEQKNPVKKIIPSKLENSFQQFCYKHFGELIPKGLTPNNVTALGAGFGGLAIICTLLTHISPLFFIGTIAGLILHHTADTLDGYVARKRGMSSKAGAYFDLITDVMFSTFFLIAFGLSPYASIEVMAFTAPLYGIVNVTAMNYIIYFNEFLFPKFGPIEAHLAYIGICILSLCFGTNELFALGHFRVMAADVAMCIGLILMYSEMIRMQIQLFRRLKKEEDT